MDEWERLERRWKIVSRIVVGLICTAILSLLLMFVVIPVVGLGVGLFKRLLNA